MNLDNLENNCLIICNNKEKVLYEINNLNKLINFKIMSLNEFYNSFFFNYNEETIYYVKNKYKVTKEIAEIYLSNLKYIINSNINNSKILFLKNLYKDLQDNNLLIYNKLFKEYLNNIIIYVIDLDLDLFTKNILDNYNYIIINTYKDKFNCKEIKHFNNIDSEVSYFFNKVSMMLKNNININNIKLIILGQEYNSVLNRYSKLYNIKFNNIENNSLYGLISTNKLIDLIKTKDTNEVLEYINSIDSDIKNDYINILNKYYFVDDLSLVLDFIIDDLKNIKLKENIYSDAINIINLNDNITDLDYVFVLGFNLENIPKTYKDIDYLNDSLKENINMFTSTNKNINEKNKVIKEIKSIKNLYISYKDMDYYNSYLVSNLINDLNLEIKDDYLENNTSNLYNKILLTDKLDNLIKYNVKDQEIDKLYNTYKDINYLKYDNSYKKFNINLNNITLSYTSLNNYYHCSFRYYIDNILKLNIYEESFKQYIGTMFHDILSRMYNKDFNFEFEWNNYIKDKEFSKKELFYLKDLKEELKNVINVLNYQYLLTGLTNLKFETKIDIKNDKYTFTGIIDKIMFKEKDNNTYISIIDYKTGNVNINLDNLKYGIDMQLPIYVYLTLKSNLFNNPKVIGFYLQKIINEKSNDLSNNLKLQGYSINDQYLVSIMDSTYENSEMIKGMKISSKGFYNYTKVFSDDELNNILNIVEERINDAFRKIDLGNFDINPKVIKGENVGCNFCKYQDLCFKTGKDLVYLKEEN